MAWLTGWSYRKKITVDADLVAAALTDFPIVVDVGTDEVSTETVTVSGCGDASCNGVYTAAGSYNGKTYYGKTSGGTRYLFWFWDDMYGEDAWVIHSAVPGYLFEAYDAYYYQEHGVAAIDGGTWYVGMEGSGSAPTSLVADTDVTPGTGDSDLATYADEAAADIRVTTSDGETLCDYEIEHWVAADGRLLLWFKAPALSATVDTDFYLYFGNATATDAQDPAGVWDNGFEGVYHLADLTTSTVADSTETNNGTKTAANNPIEVTAGKLGPAQSYGGTGTITVGTWDPNSNGDITLSAWVYVTSSASHRGIISKRDSWNANDARFTWGRLSGATGDVYINRPPGTINQFDYSLPLNQWVFMALTHDVDGNDVLYVDGQSVDTASALTFADDATATICIGSSDPTPFEAWVGMIDEARIAAGLRSAGWIETEFNNQDDPASFYTLGALEEESGGGSEHEAVAVAGGGGLATCVGLRSAVGAGAAGGSGLAAAVGTATYQAFGAAVGGLLATLAEAAAAPVTHQAFGAAGGRALAAVSSLLTRTGAGAAVGHGIAAISTHVTRTAVGIAGGLGLAAVEAGSWGPRPPAGTDTLAVSLREVAEFTGYGYLTSLAVVGGTCYVGCEHGEAPLYTVTGDGFTAVELPLDEAASLGYVQALLVDDDDGSLWAFGWQHGFDGVLDDPFELVEVPVGSGNYMTRLASLTGSGGEQGDLTPTVWRLPDGGTWTLVATGPEEGALLRWAHPVAIDGGGLACGLCRLTTGAAQAGEGWRGLVADGALEQVETSVQVAALGVVGERLVRVRRGPGESGWSLAGAVGGVSPHVLEGAATTLAAPEHWPPQALVRWLGRGWVSEVVSGVQQLHSFVAATRTGPWWRTEAHGRYNVLTTWRGRLVMFGVDDDGEAVWGAWDPPRMVLGRSAGDWRVRQARDFAGDLWCIGTQPHAIFGASQIGRQAVLVAGGGLRLDSLTVEWGDGTGGYSPTLTSVALEWAREHPTALALKSVAVEWGDGTGTHTPLLRRLTAQWGDNHALNQPTVEKVEVVWGKGGGKRPTLTGLTAEWGDGLGAAQPTLTSLGVQWRVGSANIKRPRLTSLTVEHGDGSGDNTPSLTSLVVQWSDGTGAAQPTLTSLGLQWSIGYTRGRPSLTGLEAQWADTGPMPPRSTVALVSLAAEWAAGNPLAADDAVLWLTKTLAADCVGVRVVTPLTPARSAALECLIRCDREDADVDDWDSYQRFGANRTVVVRSPGREVRVGIVGPAIFDRPDVFVQFHVDE